MQEKFEKLTSRENAEVTKNTVSKFHQIDVNAKFENLEQQEQTDAENMLLLNLGPEIFFNNREYIVKNGDGFSHILRGLFGSLYNNLPKKEMIEFAKILDANFQKQNGFMIDPYDKVVLKDGSLTINRKNKKIFEKKLPIPVNKIQFMDQNDFDKKFPPININKFQMTQESTAVNRLMINPNLPQNEQTTYERISVVIDGVLTTVGVVTAGVVILCSGVTLAPALCTALMAVSIGKCLADVIYEYKKTGEFSSGDAVKLGINIGASVLDKYTIGHGSRLVRGLGTAIDELSDPFGQVIKEKMKGSTQD